jgi:hypothetical protein
MTMKLPLRAKEVPTRATVGGLLLERQRLEHNEADYAAVMSARPHLRAWSGDDWPEDSFTLEQNRKDLEAHVGDAASGFAFGYSVLSESGAQLVGSVYLYPSAFFAGRYQLTADQKSALERSEVLIDYWLLPALEAGAGHRSFVTELKQWLATDWQFAETSWATRPAMEARRALYAQVGFRPLVCADSLHTEGWRMWFHVG